MKDLDRVKATMEHALDLGGRLREADAAEVKAACGLGGVQVLTKAMEVSIQTDAWLSEGKLVMMSGISAVPSNERVGAVWMLASPEVDAMPRCLLHGKREYVQELLKGREMLMNFVDNRNTKAQRWLIWLGFTMGEPEPFGIEQLPFRPFWLSAKGETQRPSPGHDLTNRVEVTHV
jgi:hypothetical protein